MVEAAAEGAAEVQQPWTEAERAAALQEATRQQIRLLQQHLANNPNAEEAKPYKPWVVCERSSWLAPGLGECHGLCPGMRLVRVCWGGHPVDLEGFSAAEATQLLTDVRDMAARQEQDRRRSAAADPNSAGNEPPPQLGAGMLVEVLDRGTWRSATITNVGGRGKVDVSYV